MQHAIADIDDNHRKPLPGTRRALYFCDFLPGNGGGGSTLMARLLAGYPEELTIISSSRSFKELHGANSLQETGACIILPTFARKGRWGLGRLRSMLDWLALPVVTVAALLVIRRRKPDVILSVAHGQFFIAAALASRMSGVPLVLWVHDDWVSLTRHNSFVLKYFCEPIFRFAVRSAGHIYAIGTVMADWLRSAYGVEAEVQMPGCAAISATLDPAVDDNAQEGQAFRIAFAGTCVAADETLKFLAGVVKSGGVLPDGRQLELHLYLPNGSGGPELVHQQIFLHPWLSQADLKDALRKADVLFLPYNFSNSDSFIPERSFPSKASDYLSCGKPMLLMAPPSAGILPYAREHGFAEIVDRPSQQALVTAIRRLAADSSYRATLARNGLECFKTNHDIAKQREAFYRLIDSLERAQK